MKLSNIPVNSYRLHGFTLIELMVTVAVAAILMAVAMPNYNQFVRNSELSDAVNNFTGAVNSARANAMKQGRNTYVEPLDGSTWSSGWRVYADADWSEDYTAGTDELVIESSVPSAGITITAPTGSSLNSSYMLFDGSGYPKLKAGGFATGKLELKNQYRTYYVNIDRAGRVRTCRTPQAGCS